MRRLVVERAAELLAQRGPQSALELAARLTVFRAPDSGELQAFHHFGRKGWEVRIDISLAVGGPLIAFIGGKRTPEQAIAQTGTGTPVDRSRSVLRHCAPSAHQDPFRVYSSGSDGRPRHPSICPAGIAVATITEPPNGDRRSPAESGLVATAKRRSPRMGATQW